MRLSFIPLLLLALPFLEIAGFVVVGERIGVLPTLGLVVATGVLGAFLMRLQGFGIMSRIQSEMKDGRDPGRELAHGVMILLAGVLLLIPGFITDILGLLLFVPPLRDMAWRFLRSRVSVVSGGFGGFARADRRRAARRSISTRTSIRQSPTTIRRGAGSTATEAAAVGAIFPPGGAFGQNLVLAFRPC